MANIATLVESNLCVADMEDFFDKTGTDIFDAMDKLNDGLVSGDYSVLTALIWIALRHEKSGLTFEQARFEPISQLQIDRGPPKAKKVVPSRNGKKTPTAKRKR